MSLPRRSRSEDLPPRSRRARVLDAGLEFPAGAPPSGGLEGLECSSEEDDARVVRRVLDGDEDAFGELVRRYSRRAFWIAWHVLGAVEDARDVVQEAFLRLHRSLDRYDFARSFYTWFYRIVMNLAIDALRKRRSARAIAVEDFDLEASPIERPSRGIERDEERALVWRALDALDPKFRAVLVLRDIHGMSSREIAPILGVTHVTARWRLHRGRQLFREEWARLTGETAGPSDAAAEDLE
ncbi:MAG: sigma-70 family RNA polymerase sigma factor [Planctomycetes bacterium]|nr:sigma-70 family RNA polymerase sigma factor [Planctomycetota bacterium]